MRGREERDIGCTALQASTALALLKRLSHGISPPPVHLSCPPSLADALQSATEQAEAKKKEEQVYGALLTVM